MRPKYKNDLKFLKFIVYAMGLVIFFASAFVIYTIYLRSLEAQEIKLKETECVNNFINIDGFAKSATMDNSKIIILTESRDGKQKIITFDSCSLAVLTEVEIHNNIPNNHEKDHEAPVKEHFEETNELLS